MEKNELITEGEEEGDTNEDEMLTEDLEERIENMLRVKPSNEPSLAGCLAVIDNLQEENDQLHVKCEMFEELVDNQNTEIQAKNAKLVKVSEEKQFMKEQMLKLEQHLEVMFAQCETHKSSLGKKLQQQQLTKEGPNAETQGETQEEPNQVPTQAAPPVIAPKIWRSPGHPTLEVDECIQNVKCSGNCEHVKCHKEVEHEQKLEVICYDCKQKLRDKCAMMDHKRNSFK